MENYSIYLPAYTIGPGAYEKVGAIVSPYGKKVCIIGGRKALAAALPSLTKAMAGSGLTVLDTLIYGTDCTDEAVEILAATPAAAEAVFTPPMNSATAANRTSRSALSMRLVFI